MGRVSKDRITLSRWLGILFVLTLPLAARGGLQPQGLQPQGLQPQGLQPQGLQPQGLQPQGLQPQGLQPQGLQPQGLQPQGLQPQGLQPQGLQPQGLQPQGVFLMGTDLLSSGGGKGVMIKSVQMRGFKSSDGIVSHSLTRIPEMSTGSGNYIAVGSGSAVGHYAVAHLADATNTLVAPPEDLDLFIADGMKDPVSNLFHRFEDQDNQDWIYLVYFLHQPSGQWISLCPYDAHTKMASAMAIPEGGPDEFIFACTATGVASKCARGWGFRPWASSQVWQFNGTGWSLQTVQLQDYYNICKDAARAGYCQDPRSYTKAGTLVDLFDTSQAIWPNWVENPFSPTNPDSQWMMAQEYFISTAQSPKNLLIKDSALQRSRYRELSPVAECKQMPFIDRLEHDHIEDGRWASPLTGTPRLQVFSPTHCTHDEYTEGPAIPWDCTPCTTQVCKTMPECCGAGMSPSWGATCVGQAQAVCKTGTDQWPKGRVWPAGVDTSGPPILPKYLFGPQGAVLRVEGTSGLGTSVTVSGWACDPEWPDATVGVAIYGAPRDTVDEPLAIVQADQALASPLAREVSAACDGPGRQYARHGFSYTLPANQSGNVFVYALDTPTADGKPAPDTLIRNGIIHVPRCAHSEHVTGAALDAGCSACAGSVCASDATCCSTAWTDACADLANTCAPTDSSAPANSRVYTAVTTGWIEAPADGSYTFESSLQKSRLFINGTPVLDWFESPGMTSGTITLRAGQKYHLRWDRLQSAPPPGGSGPGLTWQPPGTVGQVPIPPANLYALAPGGGGGLKASYFDGLGLTGTQVDHFAPTPDPVIDINTDVQPPSPTARLDIPATFTLPYSAIWEGEVVPSFTESYTFHIVGTGTSTFEINDLPVAVVTTAANTAPGGCAHDLCDVGPKLDASCNTCVQSVCAEDPFCCNGGYLSYYSFEPVWDAKCIAEVNQYCGAGLCSTPPTGIVATPEKKLGPVPMQAGVRYKIKMTYDSDATNKTIQLLWSSDRQAKQIVPSTALFPKDPPAAGAGAGLNVTYFGTTSSMGVIKPDLSAGALLAVGFVSDFSLTPTIGQTGTPVVDLLAAPSDTAAATPPPPMVVRPRYEDHVSGNSPQVVVEGIGGLPGGSVRIGLDGDPTVEVFATVQADGAFSATVGVGSFSTASTPPLPKVLKLLQRAPGATCVVPTTGECSYEITWPVLVEEATNPIKAPEILSPKDPTHSPNPLANTFNVVGQGTSADTTIIHEGGLGSTIDVTTLSGHADGSISGTIHLSPGSATDMNPGWHKLSFSQGGLATPPVFISVGIDPPTVEFPRSGAEIDCEKPDGSLPPATGTIPYPADKFPLQVFEETGREDLREFGVKTRIIQPQQQGDPVRFESFYDGVGPGRHVLVFFQAPPPPQDWTPRQKAAHFRAFSSVADTPTSRIVVNVPPRRFPIPRGLAGVVTGGRGFTNFTAVAQLPPPTSGPFTLGAGNCDATSPSPLCAEPYADVNIRIDGRLETKRADANGNWAMVLPLHVGWNKVTLAQVTDSAAGGAWQESCESNEVDLGVRSANSPTVDVPLDIEVPATGPKGAKVTYPDVTAVRVDGSPVSVDCVPASGSIFPVGRSSVLCTAIDPATGAVGLGEFAITVLDGAPTISATDLTLEASTPLGTTLTAYTNVTAFDVVDPHPTVSCVPAAPHFFLLDEIMPVVCEAKDNAGLSASTEFNVRVVDTTPPLLCDLPDIKVASGPSGGAFVNFNPCAKDIVDGESVDVTCSRAPGSLFPVGKTIVTCSAVDHHQNKSPPSSFTVEVGDGTPPVLKLPTLVTATATSRDGARVNYTVSATDNVDPKPIVKCDPPSGALFHLGTTTVNCKASDAAGNTSSGSFIVKVTVAWSGLLAPIDGDGSGRFLLGLPIKIRFALTGASANIWDLPTRLFVAPLDANGKPGPERPAAGLPPGAGNLFYFIPIINQYVMLLDTRPLSAGPWQLRVDLGDGEIHADRITLFKLF